MNIFSLSGCDRMKCSENEMWVSNEGILATLPLYILPMEFPEILKAKSGNIYRVLFTLESQKKVYCVIGRFGLPADSST